MARPAHASPDTLRKVFNAWQISHVMAHARGYTVPDDPFVDWEAFQEHAGDDSPEKVFGTLEYTATSADSTRSILFHFSPELKIGNTVVTSLASRCEEEGLSLIVLIYFTSISASAEAMIRDLRARKIIIQPFSIDMMQFDPTESVLQPKFSVCSAEKKTRVLAEYGVKADALPGIKAVDPVVRWFGLGKGVLVEILRSCPTLSSGASASGVDGKEISYRIVV